LQKYRKEGKLEVDIDPQSILIDAVGCGFENFTTKQKLCFPQIYFIFPNSFKLIIYKFCN
jgi:hypothetical protein